MTHYTFYFVDGSTEVAMIMASSEAFRIANGGLSDVEMVKAYAKKTWPNKKLSKVIRTYTGKTMWKRAG